MYIVKLTPLSRQNREEVLFYSGEYLSAENGAKAGITLCNAPNYAVAMPRAEAEKIINVIKREYGMRYAAQIESYTA